MNVLVVEDDNNSSELILDVLHNINCNYRFASDGAQGLVSFRNFKPKVVITDMYMPHLSGLDLVKKIKEEEPETIFVVLSHNEQDQMHLNLKELGVEHFISKNNIIEELELIIKNFEYLYAE